MGYTRWPVINSVLTAANAAALPKNGTADGTLGVALDTHRLYVYNASTTTWTLLA
jgi:hypothetical protein